MDGDCTLYSSIGGNLLMDAFHNLSLRCVGKTNAKNGEYFVVTLAKMCVLFSYSHVTCYGAL